MTINIADNSPRVSYSVAQGVTQTSFTVSFEFFDNDDLNVYVDGVLKTLTTDYTVTGGDGSTGTVTISVTGASGGSTVVITRDIDLERTTDFPASGAFNIATLNTELDRIIAIAADLDDRAARALQLTDFDVAAGLTLPVVDDRKGRVLGFNAVTGAVEAGPSIADTESLANVSADIALLADIQDGTTATNSITIAAGISPQISTVAGIQTSVITLDGINPDIVTVAGISTNVTTVAGVATDVAALGPIATDITTVSSNNTNVTTVATNINAVNTVASNISNINTVANDLLEVVSEIETVANDLNEATSEIEVVANNIANVNTVGTISGNVTTVAGISADVTAVAADASDIGTVATNIVNVNTLAPISGDITTVSGISANVTTVAGISANVTTVAGDTANIGTIATNLNGTDTIGAVAGAITNVNNVGGNITNVNTVANNLTSINSFANTYRIGTTDPTTSLDTGDLFYNTTSSTLKVYTGSAWEQGVTAGSGFLPLSGGTLTGTLTLSGAPTQNLHAASKQYVDTEVAAIIDSAPATLDTLNELAAALGDDANFSATVTNSIATKLPLAGGTMSGAIAMGTNKITGLGDPTAAQDAATQNYVNTQDALKLSLSGGTMSGAIAMGTSKITGLGEPTASQDASTKNYVDTAVASAGVSYATIVAFG